MTEYYLVDWSVPGIVHAFKNQSNFEFIMVDRIVYYGDLLNWKSYHDHINHPRVVEFDSVSAFQSFMVELKMSDKLKADMRIIHVKNMEIYYSNYRFNILDQVLKLPDDYAILTTMFNSALTRLGKFADITAYLRYRLEKLPLDKFPTNNLVLRELRELLEGGNTFAIAVPEKINFIFDFEVVHPI